MLTISSFSLISWMQPQSHESEMDWSHERCLVWMVSVGFYLWIFLPQVARHACPQVFVATFMPQKLRQLTVLSLFWVSDADFKMPSNIYIYIYISHKDFNSTKPPTPFEWFFGATTSPTSPQPHLRNIDAAKLIGTHGVEPAAQALEAVPWIPAGDNIYVRMICHCVVEILTKHSLQWCDTIMPSSRMQSCPPVTYSQSCSKESRRIKWRNLDFNEFVVQWLSAVKHWPSHWATHHLASELPLNKAHLYFNVLTHHQQCPCVDLERPKTHPGNSQSWRIRMHSTDWDHMWE